jgi:outer membrane protein assembly factor BamB
MPEVLWRFPKEGNLCSLSTTGGRTTNWCGIGWTGQPAVWQTESDTWLAVGAYDRGIHFLDTSTGLPAKKPFITGDIVKGSLTVDPDGFPLIYSGSRDGHLRILAFDRPDHLTELWSLAGDQVNPVMWNDDWDAAPLILHDHLITGGENSWLHIVRLNRSINGSGLVTVDPQIIFQAPGWDDDLLAVLGDNNVSIENSVAVSGNTAWFANSGGLVQGWDLEPIWSGNAPSRTFRWWMGDDVDATILIDDEGFLYVAAEYERATSRSRDVGQLVKLDPRKPEAPVVWSLDEHETLPSGIWSTPALHKGVLFVTTNSGRLMSIDRFSGEIMWTIFLEGPLWSSPVVVDDILIVGDCGGYLRAYSVQQPKVKPIEIWRIEIGGCIEATPAVWDGRIYVGSREGGLFAIGER